MSIALSLGVAATSLATLAGRLTALTSLDAVVTPLIVMLPTAAEGLAFVLVYGKDFYQPQKRAQQTLTFNSFI